LRIEAGLCLHPKNTIMKKLLPLLILLCITALLMPSCNNSSMLSLTKRHYRSDLYVDRVVKKNNIKPLDVAKVTARPEPKTTPAIIIQPKQEAAFVTPAPVAEKLKTTKKIASTKQIAATANKTVTENLANENISPASNNVINTTDNVSDHEVRVDANIAFLVIVLCAIFIPPLGVGLMYGIHAYFWIDLILTLIFFIPGMIFALVVVLT